MIRLTLLYLILSVSIFNASAQVTTVSYGKKFATEVKDAMVGSAGLAEENFADEPILGVHKDNAETGAVQRTLIDFNVSNIPENAIIISANLTLFSMMVEADIVYSMSLERVSNSWDVYGVNWYDHPESFTSDRIEYSYQNIITGSEHSIDVKAHVQNMVSFPSNNHGWMLKLSDESERNGNYGIIFHSSETNDSEYAPKLVVEYILPLEIIADVSHCSADSVDGSVTLSIANGSNNYNFCSVKKIDSASGQIATENLTVVGSTTSISNNTLEFNDLEPGLYEVYVRDALHNGSSTVFNQAYLERYSYFLVGKEGAETTCILANTRGVSAVQVLQNISSNAASNDWQNINQKTVTENLGAEFTGSSTINSSNTWSYKSESLMDFNIDFDPSLSFSQATLNLHAWSSYYQTNTSSNAANYTVITEPWNQHVVTWNSKPSTDPSVSVTSPQTAKLNGHTVNPIDIIDIKPLVNYWQSNPNHGFQIALASYNQPSFSRRSHKKLLGNENGYLELTFTVKSPISANFDDSTGLGTITVNAPYGDLPYTYLIGYDSIPDLNIIWQSIKDSIPVDSVSFFRGKESNFTHAFSGLKNGEYHTAVFDNSGLKIFEETAILKPNFNYFQASNLSIDNDGVASHLNTAEDVAATLVASLKNRNDGGFKFRVVDIDNGLIGFNMLEHNQIRSALDLEFGLEINSNGSTNIYHNKNLVGNFNIEEGDELHLFKKDKKFNVSKNGTLIFEGITDESIEQDYKIDLFMEGNSTQDYMRIEPVLLTELMTQIIIPIDGSKTRYCGEIIDVLEIDNPFTGFELRIRLTDLLTGITTYYNSFSSLSIPLSVGTYTVTLVLNDPNTQTAYPGGSQSVNVGYDILWDLPNSSNHTVTVNNELKSDPFNLDGLSTSVNTLPDGNDEFVSFKVKLNEPEILLSDPKPVVEGSISLYDQGGDLIKVRVLGLGFNLISRYLVFDYNNSTNANAYITDNENSEYKILYQASSVQGNGNIEVYENTSLLLTLPISTNSLLKVKGETTPYACIYDTKVSFCYPIPDQYVQLKRKLTGGFYKVQPDNILKVEYFEEYNDLDQLLNFRIRDKTGATIINSSVPSIITGFEGHSDNRLDFDVTSLAYNEFYTLEIINDKNETFYLRFKK